MAPDAGAVGAAWRASHDGPQPYAGINISWDVPIRMSDGTILRANVYRPADKQNVATSAKTPVIVTMTPYTKLVSAVAAAALQNPVLTPYVTALTNAINLHSTPIDGITDIAHTVRDGGIRTFSVDYNLVRSGYTTVVIDVRGTGFSQGHWDVFGAREQQDSVEVIDWASRQRWSNGKVGMMGVSYSAINQIQAANKRPAALKAIMPVEPGGDLIRDIVTPGGAVGVGFLPLWLGLVNGTKLIPNVASMLNGTFDWKWLAARVSDPVTFFPQFIDALTAQSYSTAPDELKALLLPDSRERRSWLDHADQITTPTMIYGGWFDLFTNSEVRMFNNIPLPAGHKQLIMGPGYHTTIGGGQGQAGTPPRLDVLQKAWFDHWLKGVDNGVDRYGPVNLKQIGGTWVSAQSFPRPGMVRQRLYLDGTPSGTAAAAAGDGSLRTAPSSSHRRLTVAPGLLSVCSRDGAQQTAGALAIFPGCADDARVSEHDALTFTSAPLTEARSISGPINLHLNTVLDATDGYFTATLNDVAPDGRSTVVNSGQLVVSMRALDTSQTTYGANGDVIDPFYTLTLGTRQPAVPGKATPIDLGILPTDAVIKAGHRLRIDVFAMNLPRGLPTRPSLNASGLKPEHILLDPASPSFVNLPISAPLR